MSPPTPEPTIRQIEDDLGGLRSASFIGLLITQMLGAANDNIFRWFVIGIGKEQFPTNIAGILMAGTACMVAPYILFATHAGYFADRYSKRSVIVWCKVIEIVVMLLGVMIAGSGNLIFLFVIVFALGAQSALYGPAKLGAIPEILKTRYISAANGMMGLATVLATAVGAFVGNALSDITKQGQTNLGIAAIVLLGTAAVGLGTSLLIGRLPVNRPDQPFPWNPFRVTVRDLMALAENKAILRVALGTAFFWSLAGLAQLNIDQLTSESGGTTQTQVAPLLIALVFGVAAGCGLAGYWSQGRVELGILPLGAAGLAITSFLLFAAPTSMIEADGSWNLAAYWVIVLLFTLGVSAGLFEVPLAAFLQHRSPPDKRGRILAANNFMTFGGLFLVSILFMGMRAQVLDGSLGYIPKLQQLEVSEEFREGLAVRKAEYARALNDEETGRLTNEQLSEIATTEDEAKLALSELLWVEYRHDFEAGRQIDFNRQLERFPNHQQLVAEVFRQASGLPLLTSRQIFFLCGLITIPIFVFILYCLPQASLRFIVWLASESIYRIRVYDRENLPAEGGALLVSNHVSWLDGVLLLLTSSRPVRMLVWGGNFTHPRWRRFAEYHGAILIDRGPKGILKALQEANAAIAAGELVCVFAEGGITRTGQVQGFRPGLMRMVDGTNAPIIPVYIDELWGSIFSFSGGRFFRKWPRGWQTPISIHFGRPLAPPYDIHTIRQSVQRLGAEAVKRRFDRIESPTKKMLRVCKRRKFGSKVADSTGADLSGGMLLVRTIVLNRLLNRKVLAPRSQEKHVGLLLPPTVAGVVTNAALALDRRVAVNLNYTVSSDVMNQCIRQAGIKHVITSRKFMEKFDFKLDAEVVFLEDFKTAPTPIDKVWGLFAAYVLPCFLLDWIFGLNEIQGDDTLTVIFTSGSTGIPKGVELTHVNIATNVEAVQQMVHLTREDVVIGILPFFHSFGYTITLWLNLGIDLKTAYHFSPLEPKQVGALTKKHRGTVLLSTPTFLRNYLRRVDKEDFASLEIVVAGAEKLPIDLCDSFEEKFGVRPVEGYGTTELSPLVSVNIPPSRSIDNFQVDRKEGTVGRPIPNVAARIVDLETGKELGVNEAGMLQITGPNVMKGYLNLPDKTAEVLKDGWYTTGDVAMLDEDGFIKITGRESRFSKIGGEMIPHLQIEETLLEIVAHASGTTPEAAAELGPEEQVLPIAVTSVSDPKKGERLVVLHTALPLTPDAIREQLKAKGLPNIYIPGSDSFVQVEEIPVLGTGKLDLRRMKEIAEERFPVSA